MAFVTLELELVAEYTREAQNKKELPFRKGEKIAFLRRRGDWLEGILHGKRGWFPLNYVKIFDKKTGLQVNQKTLLQAPDLQAWPANCSRAEVEQIMAKFLMTRPNKTAMKQRLRDKNIIGEKKFKRQQKMAELDTFFLRRPTLSDLDLANFIADYQQSEKAKINKKIASHAVSFHGSLKKKRRFIVTTKKLSKSAPHLSNSSSTKKSATHKIIGSIYGLSLEEIMKLDNVDSDIPIVIKYCINFIKIHGLETRGIFRVSGHQATVDSLAHLFYVSEMALIGGINPTTDVHVVAELLKKVLRDLPDPLFTYKLRAEFIKCLEIEEEPQRIIQYKKHFSQLPSVNRSVIFYLLPLLIQISKNHKKNLMDLENLATIFGPTLLKPKDTDNLFCVLTDKSSAVLRDFLIFFDSICGRRKKKKEKNQSRIGNVKFRSNIVEKTEKVRFFTATDNVSDPGDVVESRVILSRAKKDNLSYKLRQKSNVHFRNVSTS